MKAPINKTFTKYLTFPEYDSELDELKLEWWLFHILNGGSPIDVLWTEESRVVPL